MLQVATYQRVKESVILHIGDPGLLLFGVPVFTEPILIFKFLS